MNTINLVGRLGRDPEMRAIQSGETCTKSSLAVRKWRKEDAPDWFELEVWGKQGQLLANYCKKGDQVAVQGRMTSEAYTTKDGKEQKKWVVKVSNVTLIESKRDREQSSAGWGEGSQPF